MKQWEDIPLEERKLIIKSDIYALLTTTSPSYWCKKGYLKQGIVHTPKGERVKYDVTEKAVEAFKNTIIRRKKVKYFIISTKEKLQKIKLKNKSLDLLSLMEV